MTAIASIEASSIPAELSQESLPYDNSPMHYLKFIPIIGFLFFDIINSSTNEYLLQKDPPPSLARRLQIYRSQEVSFRYVNGVQLSYAAAPMLFPTLFSPLTSIVFIGITWIDCLIVATKQELYRQKTTQQFGDGASFFY